jgi:phospholipase/lecithinase/hemolysin
MTSRTRWAARAGRALAALAAAAALASCGGGGLVEPFKPTRILAFGDELSTLEADGRKHSINAFKITDATTNPPTESSTELDCARNPIWTQAVASGFGLAFERCLGAAAAASGQSMARAGAKVADFAAQIAAVQGAVPSKSDIAVAMFGMNDILELYAQYPTRSRDDLLGEVRARGNAMGAQVNALAQSGPPVVVLTVPDLGLTPFAAAENTRTGDATRASLLSELTSAFNNRMSVALINDGRLIGLVYADIELQNHAKFPAGFGLGDVTSAACLDSAAPPACTTSTLLTNATSTTHLWAGALVPGPRFHTSLGSAAAFRALNNPF